MTPFSERNPFTLGIAGTLVLAATLTATLNWDDLPLVGAGAEYSAEFGEAAGLQADDEVRIAGVKVGEVTEVELSGENVRVAFRVGEAWVGDLSTAEIKLKTLLGRKFLALRPAGDEDLSAADPIPRDRTVTPFDVTDAFNGLADTVGAIDTEQLAASFRTISQTFQNSPEHVRTALDGLSALSNTISSRDNELAALLENARGVAGRLASANEPFDRLIDDGNLLLAELNSRRDAIRALLAGSRDLGVQLSGLVADNQAALGPALAGLDEVTGILQRHSGNLDKSLELAGPYFRSLNDSIGSGRWVDNYICGLVPENRNPCAPPTPSGGGR